ncbi:hypothetical protein BU26DRAFT_256232 [Trematosphaeria pertusa]|uniref:C3H1-type domain-containing protein n=1 Tax=Trematosphaeria pertusa TaxID=390896 RepID=A0A6A6IS65_9PLEO|nr:uncharacterized protein BU26DRAFT_256232 [Trematosphaeria pertusa]KAF2252383.1 hypothetical protein BU26DRAFT_256232 [Trematosphaeria pertusa]
MAICTFYQRGMCKFGDQCKNEHPGSQRDANRGFGGGYGGSNANRFGAFSRGGADSYRPGQQPTGAFGGGRDPRNIRFHLSREDIKADLTDQRPTYPLSCYGPGRDAPRQLIEGPVEISPEELRSRYYSYRATGNEAVAQQEEAQLHTKMEQQVKAILDDLNGAIKYVEDGADIHPNRIDVAQGKVPAPVNVPTGVPASNPFSKGPANPFSGGSQAQTSTFGQSSTPAFGQASAPAFGRPGVSAFGQPSGLSGGSAFGKPSMPGAGAFGQPSAASGGSAFGQPSAFGKPSMPGGGAFGQTSSLGQQSAFGQPSAPGTTSGFGKPSIPGQTSAFGQTGAMGQAGAFGKPAFGQTGFGQPSQPGAGASPFGQQPQASQPPPFAQAQQASQSSPFGQQPQQANTFGQPQQQQTQAPANPFSGSASSQAPAFSQTGFGKSPAFAAPQNQTPPAQPANPFGQRTQSPTAAPSPFTAAPQQANPFGQGQPQAQPQQAASPFAQQGQPAAAPGGGKPIDPKDRFKEGRPEEYEGEQGRMLEEVYRRVGQTGRFNDDEDIPLVPPKCEWITPIL